MPLLAIINMLINFGGIICAFLFPPYPIVLLCIAIPTLLMILLIEVRKKKILIEKKELIYMTFFGLLILISVFFLTIGLAILIYLE